MMRRLLFSFGCALVLGALVLPTIANADEADDQYIVASTHYSQSRWELAIEEFRRYLQRHPQNARAGAARFFLAEALVQDRKFAEARAVFDEFLAAEPQSPYARQASFRAGQASYLANDFKQAETSFRDFRQKFPTDSLNAFVLPYLGSIALGEEDFAAAKNFFVASLQQFPAGRMAVESRLGLGRAFAALGESAAAEEQFQTVARLEGPLSDDAQYHLGAMWLANGAHAQAVAALAPFEDRLAASELVTLAMHARAQAFLELKEFAAARQILTRLRENGASDPETLYRLGLALEGLGEWGQASEAFASATEANPAPHLAAQIHLRAGEALLRAGEPVAALLAFRSAKEFNPDDPGAETLLGAERAAFAAEAHGEVEQQAREFVARYASTPHFADHRRILAQSRLTQKNFTETLALYADELSENSNALTDEDRCLAATALAALDRNAECESVLTPLAKSPDSPCFTRASLLRGAALAKQGNHAPAAEAFQAVIEGRSSDIEKEHAIAQLAASRAAQNNYAEARQWCEELKRRNARATYRSTVEFVGESAIRNSRFDAAEELFALLAAEADSDCAARGAAGVAWSQFRAGKLPQAAESFAVVSEKFPQHPLAAEALLLHGQILEQGGNTDAALADYTTVKNAYSGSSHAALARLAAARLHHRNRSYDASIKEYEDLLSAFPEFTQRDSALYELAWLRRELKQSTESLTAFEKLHNDHADSPYWSDATFRLASAAFDANDLTRARDLLTALENSGKARELAPYAEVMKAQIALVEGKFDDASAALTGFEERYPRHPLSLSARFWQAETAFQAGSLEEADRLFTALWTDTSTAGHELASSVRLRQAQLAAAAKRWDDARQIAVEFKEKWPASERLHEVDYILGRVHASKAEFAEARDAYRRVLASPRAASTETAAMAQWMIGETYFHQKEYGEAVREFMRVEILHPHPKWQAAALLEAGKCEEERGEYQSAKSLYVRLLRNFPDSPVASEAADRLKAAEAQAQRRARPLK